MYAEAGDAVAEILLLRLNSCKRASTRTISGELARDLTMSEGSSIVDEEGSAELGRETRWKACTGRMTRGKMISCLGKSSSYESHPGAVDGEDQGHVQGNSRRLDGQEDMRVKAVVKDLHHPRSRYTILFMFLVPE